jgi:hypothetical protein
MSKPAISVDDDSPEGVAPESWHCVDCGFNTAPGLSTRAELNAAIAMAKLEGRWNEDWCIPQKINERSEVYSVRAGVWKQAGMEPDGGCLCIGCLEKRLGRRLRPKDFPRDRAFNLYPIGTPRLLNRRGTRRA